MVGLLTKVLKKQEEKAQTEGFMPAPAGVKAEVKNLNFYYGPYQALKDITFPIYEKKVTAIIGPSGCGKTTLLRCFNRMHDLYEGARYEGQVILYPEGINLVGKDVDPHKGAHEGGDGLPKAKPLPQVRIRKCGIRSKDKGSEGQKGA